MKTTTRVPAARSAGPVVTASGRRLPVRVLSAKDIPALVEMHDYLSRDDRPLRVLEMPDAGRERVSEFLSSDRAISSPILGIMSGPAALIRGIGQYSPTTDGAADARVTFTATLDDHRTNLELLYRLADHARAAGIGRLDMEAEPDSNMLAAIGASAFPHERKPGTDIYSLAIGEPR